MSASSLSLFAVALPLAFAAPHLRPDFWEGCAQADIPCSNGPGLPSPSWSHGPYIPTGASNGAAAQTGTGYGTGTAPIGTGTGYPIYPTGTAPAGTGVMSILPIDVPSSAPIYTNPIRSSSVPPVDLPSPISSTIETAITPVGQAEQAEDTVKGQFAASTTWDFATSSAVPTDFRVATDFIGSSPLTHTFAKENVYLEDGFLVLNVPGGQAGKSDVSCGEVYTTFDVKYASVRTWATLSEEPGVVNGMFFFESDSQETDIEFISDPNSQSNEYANNGTRALQYTNQDLNGNFENASSKFGKAPGDATSAVHEYRLDWFEDRTDFYLDGDFHHTINTNVPAVSGPWVWNNWANGNPEWTADVPVNDAPFKIQKIEMYYNPA